MKETNTKTKFKAFFAWDDDKEEKWLEKMAARGWHLQRVVPFFYSFTIDVPEKVVYRLDYKMVLDKDYADYLTIFNDSGWELVTVMANWHYYRLSPLNEKIPEIYNSNLAKAEKYRRLLLGLIPFFPIYVVIFTRRLSDNDSSLFFEGTRFFLFLIMVFFIYATIRIILKIRRLKSQIKE